MSVEKTILLITDPELAIVTAGRGAGELSVQAGVCTGEHLYRHVPELEDWVSPQMLREGGALEEVNIRGHAMALEVHPVGGQVVWLFRAAAAPPAGGPAARLQYLQEVNAYLETLIEQAPIGIILLDPEGRVIRFNRQQEANSRIGREHVMGRNIMDVFPRTYESEQVYEITLEMLSGGKESVALLLDHYYPQYYDKDMTFRLRAMALEHNHGFAIFCEIEEELYQEKRLAEKTAAELRLSQEYLAALLDASPNMVISVDREHRVLSFNKTAELELGYPAAQVYSGPVERFFPADEHETLAAAITSSGLWYGTTHILRRDKSRFPVELYSTKIKDTTTARNVATLLILKDMQETDRLRQELIQSQKMSFMGELLGSLAHQLNNPLVGVVNIADILLQKKPDPATAAHLRMIRQAGDTCHQVVARLLQFSRRSGKNPRVLIDLRDVLAAGLDLVAQHGPFGDIRFRKDLFDVPPIHGDPVLLQQAFMNVLWNCAQAAPATVSLGCSLADGFDREVEVTIADDGNGIAPDHLERIFEPFYTTREGGTGLGLSLAYWIVKDHGGRIEVKSEVGRGTRFSIRLPAVSR